MTRRWIIWVRNIVVALVVLAFVPVFVQQFGPPPVEPVAEVDGETVPRDVFEFFRAQNEDLLRDIPADSLEAGQLQDILDRQTLEALIRRFLVAQEARELGIWVANPEIADELREQTAFSPEGSFDPELFERYVVQAGLESPRSYLEEVRRDILMRKFQRIVSSPVRVSTAAATEQIRLDRTRVRLRVAIARTADFRPTELPDEEVREFAESNGDSIKRAYERRKGEFVKPGRVRARHMLFTGEDATERARAALDRVRAGEDFATLADELSEDVATAGLGGDLGFFPRGRMLPTFEEAAFALEPGGVSEPVETARGVHVIRVEAREEGFERTLEEVTPELARELLAEARAEGSARDAAERMSEALAAGKPFQEAAESEKLRLETPPDFGWSDSEIPGLGRVPKLRAAAFALDEEEPHSSRVFELPDGYALVSLIEREEPSDEELRADLERIREQRAQALRTRLVTRWYQARRAALVQAERLLLYPLYPQG